MGNAGWMGQKKPLWRVKRPGIAYPMAQESFTRAFTNQRTESKLSL